MLERDTDTRLDLNDFVEMDYYKYEDEEFKEKIDSYASTFAEEQKA